MNSYYEGIQTNNLKDIDVCLPLNSFIMLSGVSGSGKSSLAIDTIHNISLNELNQLMNIKDFQVTYLIRRYSDILPSICLAQENYNNNPRSTVATYFGLDVFFKSIYAKRNFVSPSELQFNSYRNACKNCLGTGVEMELDSSQIIDWERSIKDIPFRNWHGTYSGYFRQLLEFYCHDNQIPTDVAFSELDRNTQNHLLYEKGNKKYKISFKAGGRKRVKSSVYIGPLNGDTIFPTKKEGKFYTEVQCSRCDGKRFSNHVLQHTVYGLSIGEIYTLELSSLADLIRAKENEWGKSYHEAPLFRQILNLLNIFIDLNLGYLNLNRSIPSLSGGELQRLRLAKSVNSQFNNFLFILDEPTSGLHVSEVSKIVDTITHLRDKKNTVIVIDYNEGLRNVADKIIILGPKGGADGGSLVAEFPDVFGSPFSEYRFFPAKKVTRIVEKSYHNIKDLSLDVPLNSMVAVCGISGSGKTSFLNGVLYKNLPKSVYLNQAPLRGNSYSIVATYLGIFDEIRKMYSSKLQLDPSFFSFHHSAKGKCPNCNGTGSIQIDNPYSIPSDVICPACDGSRFSDYTLKHIFSGLNIYQFLNLTVDELLSFLEPYIEFVNTRKALNLLNQTGLGYLTLFRNISTLSGGESQRVKLCRTLLKGKSKETYLLDEPLRGLDPISASKVINLIYDIVAGGRSVFVAEHSLIALEASSYVVEFGLGGGKYGGKVIYSGKKSNISSSKSSLIKDYL